MMEISLAHHGHVHGARDGRGGQGQDVDLGAQLLEALLVHHAEALLLVDHDEAEVLEAHVVGQQAVGADHDVELALGGLLEDLELLGAGLEP